ncbi:MAG: ABC transporter ATP-binding protein [Parachlamydiales bacterium]
MSLLTAKQLTKRFDYPSQTEILRGIDLEVGPGETVAIMGRSGEGKSTLLHILGTLEKATSGELEIGGTPITGRDYPHLRNRLIGFIFQSFFLLEDYSTLDNVMMAARIGRKGGPQVRKRALELLDRVGLSHRLTHPTKLLSGGEKQRVAIARALLNNPALIFADEPSGNLDHQNSEGIHKLLLELVAQENKTLITVTHDQNLAGLCHRQYLLRDGILVAST